MGAPLSTVTGRAGNRDSNGQPIAVAIPVAAEPRAEYPADHESCVQGFESIKEKRAFERRYLPFLKTVADFDIVCEIGFHQLAGVPLTVKGLLLLNLAPPVTVSRRLDRLCLLGVVSRTRSDRDRRVQELRLTPEILQLYAGYGSSGDASKEA